VSFEPCSILLSFEHCYILASILLSLIKSAYIHFLGDCFRAIPVLTTLISNIFKKLFFRNSYTLGGRLDATSPYLSLSLPHPPFLSSMRFPRIFPFPLLSPFAQDGEGGGEALGSAPVCAMHILYNGVAKIFRQVSLKTFVG